MRKLFDRFILTLGVLGGAYVLTHTVAVLLAQTHNLENKANVFYQLIGIGGTSQTARNRLNLVNGSNISVTAADNSGSNSTDVTIATTGGGGGATVSGAYITYSGTTYGPVFTLVAPVIGNFTARNGGSFATTNGFVSFTSPASATDNLRFWSQDVIGVPTAPYTIVIAFSPLMINENFHLMGICVSDGTKYRSSAVYNSGQFNMRNWTNTTTPQGNTNSFNFNGTNGGQGQPFIWMSLSDDNGGTPHWLWKVSYDGSNYFTLLQEARNTFVTPTQVGVCIDTVNASNGDVMALYNYSKTSP